MEKFVKMITEELKRQFGEEYEIISTEKRKNNGIIVHGICIHKKGENISPVMYVDDYYEDYVKGILSIPQIVDALKMGCACNELSVQSLDNIKDYNAMRSKIRMAVINYQANIPELEGRPNRRFLDLAVVYYMEMKEVHVSATCAITNHIMEEWGINEMELFRQGCENQRHYDTACIERMDDIIAQFLKENPDEEKKKMFEEQRANAVESPMFVATNPRRNYGAVCIIDTFFLQKVADTIASNLIILPSSVHEIIIVPEEDGMKNFVDSAGVEEINSITVDAEEQLSNSIYLFDRKKGEVSIYQEGTPLCKSIGK